MLKRILFLFAIALLTGSYAAQITTSTLTGNVRSATDEALVGAYYRCHSPSFRNKV